ncbi:MAG: ATP-binding protein [Bacteroidales bacterium]
MDISLHEEISKYKAAFFQNSRPMGQILCDADMRITGWDNETESLLGSVCEEMVGQHIGNCLDQDCRENLLSILDEHKTFAEYPITFPRVQFRKENGPIYCNWIILITRKENQITGFLSFIEEAFHPGEAFYSAYSGKQLHLPPHTSFNLIFDNSANSFSYISPDFARTIAPFIDLESMATTLFAHVSEQDRLRTIKHFRTNNQHNRQINTAFLFHLSPGITRQLNITGLCIHTNNLHLFALHAKIINNQPVNGKSARKTTHQNQGVDHSFFEYDHRSQSELLGELTSGVLHELNQPIGLVQIILDNLRIKLQAGNLETDYLTNKLELIRESTARMNELIQEVKIFRRDLKGKETSLIDLNIPVRRVFDFFRINLINSQIHLSLSLQPDLPPIMGNEKWISTIVTNLLVNAKHSLNRKSKLKMTSSFTKEIKVYTWLEDNQIIMEFWDNGMGIKKKHLNLIFDPYFSTKSHEGTGIGLAIVRRYLEQLDATIEVESAARVFAKFRLTFPLLVNANKNN